MSEWLIEVKKESCLLHKEMKHFFNYGVIGYEFPLQLSLINQSLHSSFNSLSLINQIQSLFFSSWIGRKQGRKTTQFMESWVGLPAAVEGPPAHNQPIQRKENFSSINQHKPTHSLVCGLMKRKLIEQEEKKRKQAALRLWLLQLTLHQLISLIDCRLPLPLLPFNARFWLAEPPAIIQTNQPFHSNI